MKVEYKFFSLFFFPFNSGKIPFSFCFVVPYLCVKLKQILLIKSSLITLCMYIFTAPYSWTKLVYHLPLLLHLVGIKQKLFSRSKQECDKVITL